MNIDGHNRCTTKEQMRAEQVLRRHRSPGEQVSILNGPRPKIVIDALIRDIKAANAEAGE